ncbi:MAG: phosphatidylglycerol lysyltransferase [Treponema sp.]|nr:phosphatidylglycerol lysyltransferase [Treponema sp.]
MNNPAGLAETLDRMILSPSGWRGIFNAHGDEESSGEELAPPYHIITAAAAAVFAEYLSHVFSASCPLVILGRDTRPTGKTAADLMIRSFLASGCSVRFTGVAAAPEIMALARSTLDGTPGGFCYISASHNPIGYNGLKFGLEDGGVLEGAEANRLIESFRNYLAGPDPAGRTGALLEKTGEAAVRGVYAESKRVKQEALGAYRSFGEKVITGEGPEARRVNKAIREGLKTFPLGIAADFNGSARTLSIDEELFRSLGLGFHKINGNPGEIVHAIIPEGDSLESCRRLLEELHRRDPSVILGYMPDCDGDRGNLVIWDQGKGAARSLEAQEVFALACMAELAHLVWIGELSLENPARNRRDYDRENNCKTAVAVNGPTSMRIDRIAGAFGVKVFRAEVGEANVVNLARHLRKEGYAVRILGEGSNGGSITHPSSVRDPLTAVFALIKLLTIRKNGASGGLFDIWRDAAKKAGIPASAGMPGVNLADGFSLADIIASLPAFFTTAAAASEAKLQVMTDDHGLLKNRYQEIFEKEWDEKKDDLQKRWGISAWEARACVGTEELRNLSSFGDAQTGGLKIVFKSGGLAETAFIWMRGSKTEPVFRIMADAEDAALERELIAWQRAMTTKADTAE